MAETTFPLLSTPSAPSGTVPSASDGTTGGAVAEAVSLNTEHKGEALARLLEQFKEKPRIEAIICALMVQVQDTEQALWELMTERDIENAVGVQLDGLGEIVGVERQGLGDDDFRARIRAQIRVNLSDGQGEELIEILKLILDAPVNYDLTDIILDERPPAHLAVILDEVIFVDVQVIISLLRSAKAAGVRLILEYILTADADVFHTSAVVGSSEFGDTAQGFGSVFAATGGVLAGAIE